MPNFHDGGCVMFLKCSAMLCNENNALIWTNTSNIASHRVKISDNYVEYFVKFERLC